jgi:hypothetical protein
LLHRLSRQGSANVSKYQQTSANVSNCQQVSAHVSTHGDFVLEKSFSSATVSNCQLMSADLFFVSKCQQNDDDAGISNLAPARH